ncbi:DUF6192 family protein [Streptomyces sp. NPDC093261]|uniref:DUF6192 family protein n=1 Tax=Streptomyces sp. NPDC093261 TaxID=3366037 RepID=UPI003816EDB0
MFAEDVGLAYTRVRSYRWVSSRWPKERRRADVSHTIHKVLASIPHEQERFEAVNTPPPSLRGGQPRWTHASVKRVVGLKSIPWRASRRVEAIHDPAIDDAVAAVVTTDFLRRPAVASKAMADLRVQRIPRDPPMAPGAEDPDRHPLGQGRSDP